MKKLIQKLGLNPDSDTHIKIGKARRSALKTAIGSTALVATSALPGKWTTPIVSTVVLPAHGQTSEIDPVLRRRFFGAAPFFVDSYDPNNSSDLQYASINERNGLLGTIVDSIANVIVDKAEAQTDPTASMCVDDNDGTLTATYQLFLLPFVVSFIGIGSLNTEFKLTTTCLDLPDLPPFPRFLATFEEGMNDMLDYTLVVEFIKQIPDVKGSIPLGDCETLTQQCPVPD